jgi:hypothetical protein
MSTYSASPSFSSSTSTPTADTGRAEITQITQGLDRLENKHLAQQRFVPSAQKSEDLSKLALGAKLERALGRRMGDQDAVMPKKTKKPSGLLSEKVSAADRGQATKA